MKRYFLLSRIVFLILVSCLFYSGSYTAQNIPNRVPTQTAQESPSGGGHIAAIETGSSYFNDTLSRLDDLVRLTLKPPNLEDVEDDKLEPAINFNGIRFSGVSRQNNNAEDGETQFVQRITNKKIQIFDKTTGTSLLEPFNISTALT